MVIGRQSLKNIEEGIADPSLVSVVTAMNIIRTYYPEVDIGDFTGEAGYTVWRDDD